MVQYSMVSFGFFYFCLYKTQENIKNIIFYYGSKGGIVLGFGCLFCGFRGCRGWRFLAWGPVLGAQVCFGVRDLGPLRPLGSSLRV